MKTKFILMSPTGEKEFYIKRENKSFVAIYNDKEYVCAPIGTIVNYNGSQRMVTKDINVINLDGDMILIIDKGRWAGPQISSDKGKVEYNFLVNNLKASLPLLIGFIIILFLILSVSIGLQ